MSRQDSDIVLKTKLFGFDKKATMDYIEKIELENEGLKRQIQDVSAKQNALQKENAMLRSKIEIFNETLEKASVMRTEPEEEPYIQDVKHFASDRMPVPEIVNNNNPSVNTRMTFEDLSVEPDFEMPYASVGNMHKNDSEPAPAPQKHVVTSKKPVVTKKGGKTYISSKKK